MEELSREEFIDAVVLIVAVDGGRDVQWRIDVPGEDAIYVTEEAAEERAGEIFDAAEGGAS